MRQMVISAFLLALAPAALAQTPHSEPKKDSCVTCHSALEGEFGRPAQLFEADIHKKHGFSCASCHGGDPASDEMETAMDPRRGFVGKIPPTKVPEMCARCHSDAALIHQFKPQQRVDQLAQYKTSIHGKRLATGDVRVATCIDCHSVHDIREVNDALAPVHPLKVPGTCARCHADPEHMKGYKIPTDQFERYRGSVHWDALSKRGDLSAPNCATCHGNHGATPPGVASVGNVCGTCHVVFQNLFDQSPHKSAFEAMNLAACVECHSNHGIVPPKPEMLGVASGAVCVRCHASGDPGYVAAAAMKRDIDQLRAAMTSSEKMLKQAESSGMEVSEGRLQLTAANEEWIKARVQVHDFRPEAVNAAVKTGLEAAHKGYQTGLAALKERDVRRKGLAVSLISIALVIAGLWLSARYLDSRNQESAGKA
ncbi:MAG: cytochrome c3 family protein [Chloroflexi bacterium]|nr:cytochrome c3 family protein [Chloroflexota bacterium]